MPPIMATLSSTGVAAGTAKRFQVLSTPAESETIEIRPMYGNMIRVITTDWSKRTSPEAISQTIDRRGDHADDAGHDQDAEQHRGDGIDHPPGRLVALGRPDLGQGGHERLGEGALAEQAAQQVGNAEGDVEGVERRSGAEGRGDDHVSGQPGDPGGEREQGDGRRRPEQIHGLECYTRGLCRISSKLYPQTMATASKAKKKTVRIASGLKRVRQDTKLNAANTAMRSHFRTVIKNVQKAVDSGDKAKAAELFKAAQPVIDSVADKGLFHKNKAARHKSRLSAKVKALATA